MKNVFLMILMISAREAQALDYLCEGYAQVADGGGHITEDASNSELVFSQIVSLNSVIAVQEEHVLATHQDLRDSLGGNNLSVELHREHSKIVVGLHRPNRWVESGKRMVVGTKADLHQRIQLTFHPDGSRKMLTVECVPETVGI